jgi:hypothetical protein
VLVEPGAFRTDFMTESRRTFEHPAYTNANNIAVQARGLMKNFDKNWLKGDPNKLVSLLFKIADMDDPPLRVLAGKDAWEAMEKARKRNVDEERKFGLRNWSDDLECD